MCKYFANFFRPFFHPFTSTNTQIIIYQYFQVKYFFQKKINKKLVDATN